MNVLRKWEMLMVSWWNLLLLTRWIYDGMAAERVCESPNTTYHQTAFKKLIIYFDSICPLLKQQYILNPSVKILKLFYSKILTLNFIYWVKSKVNQ